MYCNTYKNKDESVEDGKAEYNNTRMVYEYNPWRTAVHFWKEEKTTLYSLMVWCETFYLSVTSTVFIHIHAHTYTYYTTTTIATTAVYLYQRETL